MKSLIINALYIIWQLPQVIIAYIMWPFLGKKTELCRRDQSSAYRASSFSGGISLGTIIYLSDYKSSRPEEIDHEYGHVKQSHLLGWLYLIVIGLPSMLWVLVRRISPTIRKTYSYYDFYTERWADKLGGVTR